MRNLFPIAMLLGAGVVAACNPDTVVKTEDIPTAGIRFINAVPDTGGMDFRPVDIVENSQFYNVTFRSTTLLYYKNARAGTRHFTVFRTPTATDPAATQLATAQTVVADLNSEVLEAGKLYTYILWGYSRTGSTPAMHITRLTDDPADPGAQVALRIINAASGRGAIDGRAYVTASGPPGTATWPAVAPLSASSYVNFAPSSTITFSATPSAAAWAPVTGAAPAGAAETIDVQGLPGTNVAGSAVTGIVVPGSVIGSQASAFVSTTATSDTVLVSAAAQQYQRPSTPASSSFITRGFLVGDTLTASGFTNAANNGISVITAVTATAITVTKTTPLVDEAKAVNRILQTPRLGIIFVWDRRPPRTCTLCSAPAH